jgi:hypothetical protein
MDKPANFTAPVAAKSLLFRLVARLGNHRQWTYQTAGGPSEAELQTRVHRPGAESGFCLWQRRFIQSRAASMGILNRNLVSLSVDDTVPMSFYQTCVDYPLLAILRLNRQMNFENGTTLPRDHDPKSIAAPETIQFEASSVCAAGFQFTT